jgi:hypothetical protein
MQFEIKFVNPAAVHPHHVWFANNLIYHLQRAYNGA